MNVAAAPPIAPAGDSTLPASADYVWHHRAFCRIALPVRASSKGVWQREAAGVTVTMEAGEGSALPTGRFARLLLMHLFDQALRHGDAVVEIGDDPAAVAERLGSDPGGVKLRELQDQMIRLLAARITVAWDGGPSLSVFDARGRARSAAPGWRSSIRINARFLAGLAENAVALDRLVLQGLAESTLALDLYAWLVSALPTDGSALAPDWELLRQQFANASQQPAEFRVAFEQALLQVQQAWPRFASVVRDDAVEFKCASGVWPESPLPAPPQPAAESIIDPVLPPEPVPAAEEPAAPQMPVPAEPVPPAPLAQVAAPQVDRGPRRITRQTVSLRSHLTGLPQVVWLQRANGRDNVVIEVTPGGRYDPETCTTIALEPLALQESGGLYTRDFERVAAWAAANRDLIDDWWDSLLDDFEEVASRVKKVPAPAWR